MYYIMVTERKVPSTNPAITTQQLLTLPTGPIPKIMESVATKSVAIDTRNLGIQAVPDADAMSVHFKLGVIALSASMIRESLILLVGGEGFRYLLEETRHLKGYFTLEITSLIGPLHVSTFAGRLQDMNHRISIFVEENLVNAL